MTGFNIVYYSATAMELPSLSAAVNAYRSLGRPVTIYARSQSQLFSEKAVMRFADRAKDADVVFLTLHGGKMSCPAFDEVIDALKRCGSKKPLLIIQSVGGDEEALLLAKEHGDCFGDERGGRIHRYFTFGGAENMLSLIKYLHAVRFETKADIPPPRTLPTEGVYHPDLQGASDLDAYRAHVADPEKPTIGIWFYQGFWINGNTAHIDALVREIERQGGNALPVFSYRLKDETLQNLGGDEVVEKYFTGDGPLVDAVISVMGMSMTLTHPAYGDVLPTLGVPYLQALVSSVPREAWEESVQGMSTMDVTFQAAQPEFDGALITVPVAAREEDERDPVTGAMSARNVPIPERTEKLAALALNWARLSSTPNTEKRVASSFITTRRGMIASDAPPAWTASRPLRASWTACRTRDTMWRIRTKAVTLWPRPCSKSSPATDDT